MGLLCSSRDPRPFLVFVTFHFLYSDLSHNNPGYEVYALFSKRLIKTTKPERTPVY